MKFESNYLIVNIFHGGLSMMMMMIVKDAMKQIWKTILSSALLFNFCNTIFDNFQWFLVLTNIWCLNVHHHHRNGCKCINGPLISSSAFLPLIQAWHRNNASRNIVIIGFVAVFTILKKKKLFTMIMLSLNLEKRKKGKNNSPWWRFPLKS